MQWCNKTHSNKEVSLPAYLRNQTEEKMLFKRGQLKLEPILVIKLIRTAHRLITIWAALTRKSKFSSSSQLHLFKDNSSRDPDQYLLKGHKLQLSKSKQDSLTANRTPTLIVSFLKTTMWLVPLESNLRKSVAWSKVKNQALISNSNPLRICLILSETAQSSKIVHNNLYRIMNAGNQKNETS